MTSGSESARTVRPSMRARVEVSKVWVVLLSWSAARSMPSVSGSSSRPLLASAASGGLAIGGQVYKVYEFSSSRGKPGSDRPWRRLAPPVQRADGEKMLTPAPAAVKRGSSYDQSAIY